MAVTRSCNIFLREVIAVNQDPMGVQGRLISSMDYVDERRGHSKMGSSVSGNHRVYSRPLQNGDVAVALLNVHDFGGAYNITFYFKDVRGREGVPNLCNSTAIQQLAVSLHAQFLHFEL